MARKNTLYYAVATNQSMATTFTTTPTLIKFLDNVCYQINIATSNSTGAFKVQGSVDYQVSEPTNAVTSTGSWTDLTLSGTPSAAGANDTISIAMNQVPYNALRIVYTPTVAGTGTCSIYINARQLGG